MSPDDATIAYSSPRTGRGDLYQVNRDGSGTRRLTSSDDFEAYPSYSPDGSQILYIRQVGGYSHLWIMNADGSNQAALTSGRTYDLSPRFTPDGKNVDFERSPPTGGLGYTLGSYRMDLATRSIRVRTVDEVASHLISPDGKTVLVEPNDNYTNPILWAKDRQGGGRRQIGLAIDPRFSPDGRKIYLLGPGYDHELRVMDADGSNVRTIAAPTHYKEGPELSLDGKYLLVGCPDADRIPVIHVIRTDDLSTERTIPTR